MAETHCCRFHKIYILLLALAAWTLVSHFFIDVLPFPQEPGISVTAQQNLGNRLNTQEVGHATGLHGSFILASMPVFASPQLRSTLGEIPDPFEIAWTPPIPLRPPAPLSI